MRIAVISNGGVNGLVAAQVLAKNGAQVVLYDHDQNKSCFGHEMFVNIDGVDIDLSGFTSFHQVIFLKTYAGTNPDNNPTNTSTSSTKSPETTILQDSMDYLLNDAFGFGESNEPIVEDEEFSEIEDQFKDYVKVKNPKISAIEIERKVVKDFVELTYSRSSAPPPIQIPRSSVPPLRQGISSTPLAQSPSSSSTSAGNHASVPPSTQPTTAPKPTPSHLDPTFIKRSSSRYWMVNVLNPSGGFNRADLTLQKLIDLEEGFRVVVDFEGLSPFGLAAGLLGAVCGLMATDYGYFPINFKNWHAEVELKKIVGRGPLYVCTHKKKNGEYTHVEAERICVEIEQEMTQNPQAFSDISTTDPVGKRHKPEHGGRVRGLGLGALPSVTLKSSRRKFRGSVYEIGETSGSSNVVLEKLDVALREVAMFRSIMKKLVPVAEYEKALREALEEEEDDSSDGSNGHFSN
ncbi:hypothetical protein ACFE04_029423 [Oxalis oulophora]